MGNMFDAFKDAAFEGITGQRRRDLRINVAAGLNTALVEQVRDLIRSGIPKCPHGHRYALESVEMKWGLAQGRDHLNFWACAPNGPLYADLVLKLVCSHDQLAGTFAVGSLAIMDASGHLTHEPLGPSISSTEDEDGEMPF